jgi:hypothetical protein
VLCRPKVGINASGAPCRSPRAGPFHADPPYVGPPHAGLLHVRQLMALAFAPLLIVHQTFVLLLYRTAPNQRLGPLFAYLYYELMQSIACVVWTVHDEDIRKNNAVKHWHNRFKQVVATHRPNIWRLQLAQQQKQAATEVSLRCRSTSAQNPYYLQEHSQTATTTSAPIYRWAVDRATVH